MTSFTEAAKVNGIPLRVIPVSRLEELRKSTAEFRASRTLPATAERFLSITNYDVPELPFAAQSLIIAVTKCYSYGELVFHQNAKEYRVYAAMINPYDTSETDNYIAKAAEQLGKRVVSTTGMIPQKMLGVSSGLAVYGRNNVTYTPEYGSFILYSTYFSDLPPESDEWRGFTIAPECATCGNCLRRCPTGAITDDEYLIDVSRCYSMLSTSPGEFPEFVPASAHHTIMRCLKCTYSCQLNREAVKNVFPTVHFSEEETAFVLSGEPYDNAPAELQAKAKLFGLGMFPTIPRNIKACFDAIDINGEVTPM
jgi:epoxyqueuosine reductase